MKIGKANKRSFSTETRCILLLIIVILVAYSNSFSGQFIFDDINTIIDNPYVHSLSPLSKVMFQSRISTVQGRPISALSLALCYTLFGTHMAGYHLFNLAIHLLASLTLFGIVRRTLLSERLRARFGNHAAFLAWITAAIWAVHPIQTESVTYIVQRCESFVGLFYLLTLYSVIRAIQSRRAGWSIIAVLCCGLGMATKEVMATAPVVILIYDRTFGAGSFVSALRRRWGLYAGLAATWIILISLMWSLPHESEKIGFSANINPLYYMMNECIVIVHYIRLSLWPAKLCIDYSWPVVKDWSQLALPMLIVVTLLGITAWGFIRNRSWSFLGVWFFGILAPTSSFVPIIDLIFEHRMYLSLAALILLFVIITYFCFQYIEKRLWDSGKISAGTTSEKFIRYIPVVLITAILTPLTLRTLYRNACYHDPILIWKEALEVSPDNPRAYINLGYSFHRDGKLDEATKCYRRSLRLKPDDAVPWSNLASILTDQGKFDEAMKDYEQALRLESDMTAPMFGIAWLLATNPDPNKRDASRAVKLAEHAMKLTKSPRAMQLDRLAAAYAANGNFEQAQEVAEKALAMASKKHFNELAGKISERLELYKQAIPYRESIQPQKTAISNPQDLKE
jgi:hypothetical protein